MRRRSWRSRCASCRPFAERSVDLNTIATYPIAATKNAKNPDLAKKFADYVPGPGGQQVLVKYGFIPTTGSASGAAPTAAPLAIGGKVDTPTTLTLDAFNRLDVQ
jgi:ABC-type Fe3+ transport system substrate-binding protein